MSDTSFLTSTLSARGVTLPDGQRDDERVLHVAVPVFWGQRCLEAINAAATAFDLSSIECVPEIVFSPYVFCWFERPFMTCNDGADPVVALSWGWFLTGRTESPVLTYSVWVQVGPLLMVDHWHSVRQGHLFSDLECKPHDKGCRPVVWCEVDRVWRWIVAANVFIRQKLLSVETERMDRAARRRHGLSGGDEMVRVVRLREHERTQAGNDESPVDWKSRWFVQGHVRKQWYPSINAHLPIWISPYIKGPTDAPLKAPRPTLVSVTR